MSFAPTAPHFAFPFGRNENGQIQTVEQDSPAHVLACANVITYCPLGDRPERPEFGWRRPYMDLMPVDTSLLEQALKQFEPRSEELIQQPAVLQQLALTAIGAVEIDVNVGTTNADPTGVGMGVND